MTRIILIGFMGSGKTTLGRALAKDLGIEFIDLDNYIELRRCKSINNIFAEMEREEKSSPVTNNFGILMKVNCPASLL